MALSWVSASEGAWIFQKKRIGYHTESVSVCDTVEETRMVDDETSDWGVLSRVREWNKLVRERGWGSCWVPAFLNEYLTNWASKILCKMTPCVKGGVKKSSCPWTLIYELDSCMLKYHQVNCCFIYSTISLSIIVIVSPTTSRSTNLWSTDTNMLTQIRRDVDTVYVKFQKIRTQTWDVHSYLKL